MRSDLSRPRCCQVLPPSIDLYTPLPTDIELRTLPSPVPTHTISGLAWKIATAPIAATGWSSKMGVKLSPPFVDFQSPPVAAPTYTMSGFDSTASIAATRPLMAAGPIARAFIPASSSGSTCAWMVSGSSSERTSRAVRLIIMGADCRLFDEPRQSQGLGAGVDDAQQFLGLKWFGDSRERRDVASARETRVPAEHDHTLQNLGPREQPVVGETFPVEDRHVEIEQDQR